MKGSLKPSLIISLGLIFAALLLLLSGCWNYRELNQIGVVSAVGLDRNEQGNIVITAQVLNPQPESSQSSGGEKAVRVLTSEGETVFDAVRNFMMISGDRLFYPHTQVIVIGEELARAGITPVLDFLERDPEIRLLAWVLLTEGKAEEIIRAPSDEDRIPAMHLNRLVEDYKSTSKSIPIDILYVTNDIFSEGIEAAIGKVDFREEKGEPTFHMEGGGAFKGDKLIDWLDASEARGYLWVHNEVNGGIITARKNGAKNQVKEEPKSKQNNSEELMDRISFEIIRTKTKVKPILNGEELSFLIDIKVNCNLGERMDHLETSKEGFSELEKILAQTVIEEVQVIVDKAQKELKSDILGLGLSAYRKYPDYWEEHKDEWDNIFPNVDVEIVVDALLADHGTIR